MPLFKILNVFRIHQGWVSAGQKGISPLPMAEIGEK
jgi:hypothetical protein